MTLNVGEGGGPTLTGGTYQATGSGTLRLNFGQVITADATSLWLLNNGNIATFDSATATYVPIEQTLSSITSSGSLALSGRTYNWIALTNDGLITIGQANPNSVLNTPQLTLNGEVDLIGSTLAASQLVLGASGHAHGAGTITGSVANAGVILAEVKQTLPAIFNPKLTINGAVTGAGVLEIGPGVSTGPKQPKLGPTLELNGPVSQNVVFDDFSGTLRLNDPTHFTGAIVPTAGNKVVLGDISLASITSYSYAGDLQGGTLTLQQASGHIDLDFTGFFNTASFTLSTGPQDLSTSPPSLLITGYTTPTFPANGGNVDEWILENGHWLASAGPGSHPAGSRVAAVADFTHDGTSDILWQNVNTGAVDLWKINYGAWAGSVDLGTHPGSGWQIAGAGDFNGDGTNDVFWFNPTTGETDIWQLANGQWAASVSPGRHPAGYQVAGIGDFNNDGTSDVLWFNPTTRHVDEWNIVNGQWAGSNDIGTYPGAGYRIAGLGDFNNDGSGDVFWHNPGTGATDIWLLQNGMWSASVSPGNHPTGWDVAGIGDFNRDGTSDVLWFNPATGNTEEWLIDNGHWAGSISLGAHPGSGWNVGGIGDFNRRRHQRHPLASVRLTRASRTHHRRLFPLPPVMPYPAAWPLKTSPSPGAACAATFAMSIAAPR